MNWVGLKGLAAELSVEKDALHVYAAFFIQILAASVFRRPLSSWLPWLCVLAILLSNEALDLWFERESHIQPWQLAGSRHDIVNTMLLPTALLLLCRFAPFLFGGRDDSAGPPKPETRDG